MDMRQMNRVPYFFICTALVLSQGCGQTQQRETIEQICLTGTTKTEAVNMAEDVLARMHFTIEKADPCHGLIRTRPLPGAQFFEFWRSDNVGPYNSLQANIHTIRRTVELTLEPKTAQQTHQLCIACDVNVQQMSLPEQPISSSARAYQMFSKSSARMQVLEIRPRQKKRMAWLDRGKDTQLATLILKRIEDKIADGPTHQQSQTTNESPPARNEE
jgi:hypothetical protein